MLNIKQFRKEVQGQVQWLMSIIPAFWEAEAGELLEVGHLRITMLVLRYQPGQHDETLSLLKIQKISQAWWCIPVVSATWEAEAAVS